MTEIPSKILTNVLTALYQPFWFAALCSVLIMVLYLYGKEHGGGKDGLKAVATIWKDNFLHNSTFRRLLLLAFYCMMILFRTLLNRNLWLNPLSDIMGGWTLTDEEGKLTTEPIENLMLFVPFSILLLWAVRDKILKGSTALRIILWQSTKIVFLFSLSIETLQLLLRLGTFQLSDLFYNTLGGSLGGLIYWVGCKVKNCKEDKKV